MQHVSIFPSQRTHLLLAGWFTLLTLVGEAQFSQVQKITANPREASANFGNRVAIDGDVMVVAASEESGGGAAYVFEKSGVTWQQTARLVASDRGFADQFGRSVAVSGNTIVVGDNLQDQDGTGVNNDAGAAYVFEKSGGTWSQTQKLVASVQSVTAYFGSSVGISGNTIVVGAFWEAQDASGGNTLAKAGAAYVFGKSGSTWSQTQKLVASDRSASDTFGYSVAVSGTTIVVGAIFDDHDASGGNPLGDAGSAYVFEKGSTWSQTRKLVASDRGENDEFGYSVAISGTTIVVGAFWEDHDASGGNSLTNAGSAYVFDKSVSTWSQTQKLVASDRGALDQFGIFVGISGTTLVVGANYDAQNASGGGTLNYAGSAYVFGKSGSTWSQTQKLVASDRGQDDYFGISVGISGNTLVVGAFFEDQDASGGNTLGGAGSAYVFATCDAPTATVPTLGASTICQGGNTSVSASFGGGASSGSFSDGGAGGTFSVSTSGSTVSGTYTPAASYSGTATITFTTNDPDGSGGCAAATSTGSLTVNAAATASTPTLGTSTICQGSSTSVSASFGGSASSGSFSDGGKGGTFSVSTNGSTVSGTYTPAASYSGTTTITFTTNDPDGPCGVTTSTVNLTVNPAATASAVTVGTSPICQGSNVSLSASFGGSASSGSFSDGGAGGAFSGVSTSNKTVSATYTPASGYSGTTTITFATNDPDGSGGCTAATSTGSLTVNAAATASTPTLGTSTICQGSSTSVSASFGGSASSGSFSDGEAGGTFSNVSINDKTVSATYTPAASFSGLVTIGFTTNDPDGPCVATTSTVSLTVNPAATANAVTVGTSPICQGSSTSVSASFGGGASSGSFSDGGAGGSFNVSTNGKTVSGTYTPAASYSGTTTITFATNDPDEGGPCAAATSTGSLTVNPAATASTPTLGASPICQGISTSVSASFGGGASSGSFSDGEAGGTFSNVSTSNKTVSATYIPAASFSGTATITFTTNDPDESGPCAAATSTVNLTVNALPVVSLSALAASYCQNALASTPGTPAGGSYSIDGGSPVAIFDPASLTTGPHAVVYTYTTGAGCSASATASVTIIAPVFTQPPSVPANFVVCANGTVSISFNVNCPTNASFTAELSNPAGSFASGTQNLGPVTPGQSNTVTIPGMTSPSSANYRLRVVGSNPTLYSDPTEAFRINALDFNSTPTVSLTAVCVGSMVKVGFTVSGNCGFLPGNDFSAELLHASLSEPLNLGEVNPGLNNVVIPRSVGAGSGYRIRIRATAPGQVSTPSAAFSINQPSFSSTPTVSLDNKCAGEAVRLSFTTASCAFPMGNTFTAQLSDKNGSFANSVSVGTVTPGGLNNVRIPTNTPAGTGYKLRIVSSNPEGTSATSGNFKVKACTNREVAPEESGLRVVVSPNPSPEGRVRITVSGAEGQDLRVELFNGFGQWVREQRVLKAAEAEVLDWDISRQPGGLYLLRVVGAKEVKTLKVLH